MNESTTVATRTEDQLPARAEPQAQASDSVAMMQMIERASRDPAVDIDKMRQLFAWKRELEVEAQRREFNSAMSDAQAAIKPVARNADNTQTKSKYATLDKIDEAISPIITSHGFALSFDTADSKIDGCYRILCEVSHRAGYSKTYHADIPIDGAGFKGTANKTATHAFVSTMSYGRRALTMMIFNVTTKNATPDDDGNGAGGKQAEMLSADDIETIRARMEAAGVNEARFLKFLKVERFEDIFANKYDAVIELIENAARERVKGAAK